MDLTIGSASQTAECILFSENLHSNRKIEKNCNDLKTENNLTKTDKRPKKKIKQNRQTYKQTNEKITIQNCVGRLTSAY